MLKMISRVGDSTASWANCSCVQPPSQWQKKFYIYMAHPVFQFASTTATGITERSDRRPHLLRSLTTRSDPPEPSLLQAEQPHVSQSLLNIRCSSPFIIPVTIHWTQTSTTILDTTPHLSGFVFSFYCSKQGNKMHNNVMLIKKA